MIFYVRVFFFCGVIGAMELHREGTFAKTEFGFFALSGQEEFQQKGILISHYLLGMECRIAVQVANDLLAGLARLAYYITIWQLDTEVVLW